MNTIIKIPLQKKVVITDDKIIHGKKEYLLSSITKAELKRLSYTSSVTITYGESALDWTSFSFDHTDNSHVEAIEYVMSCVYGKEERKKEIEKQKEIEEKGYRKRCNVCGKIICYTLEDIAENKRKARSAALSGLGGIAGALSGNYAAGATSNQSAEDQLSRIVDYDKCPSCGSRDLVDLTDEDIAKINAQQNGQSAISSADELKKFKELLDMGVISQEEFDQKKKQLLGL